MKDPEYGYRITDYDRSLVPSRFVAFLDDGVTEPDQWVARSGRSLGHPGWGWVYHSILMLLDPQTENRLVETGTNLGTTTMLLAQALIDSGRPGHVDTIEINPEIHREANRRFALAGVENFVTSHLGDSVQVLQTLTDENPTFAAAFLDGNHFHDHVLAEFEIVHRYVRDEGAIFLDNTGLIAEGTEDPRVNGAIRTIIDRFGGNVVNFPFASWYTPGIAIWQRQPFDDMTPPSAGSFVPDT